MKVQLYLNNNPSPFIVSWWQCKRTKDYLEMTFSEAMPVIPERGEFVRLTEGNQVLQNRILFEGYVEQATKDHIKLVSYYKYLEYIKGEFILLPFNLEGSQETIGRWKELLEISDKKTDWAKMVFLTQDMLDEQDIK